MGQDQLFQKRKKREEELRRRKANRLRYVTIFIVSEGDTEYNYFNDMRRFYRQGGINFILEKPKGSAPINIVDFTIKYIEKNEDIDYVFCVFDRDEHVSYNKALGKINNHKTSKKAKSKPEFKAITSVPCFEKWILSHFVYSTKSYSRIGNKSACDNIINDLREYLPNYTKTNMTLFTDLYPKLNEAIENSKKLFKYNIDTGSFNPATNMYELIEVVLNNLKK